MPAPIACPHCQEHLEIPAEFHGQRVRCANCQNVFVATPADDPPVVRRSPDRVEDSDAPYPRPARPGADDADRSPPRRSNAGVVMLLLFVVLCVGGCCGGINLVMLFQTNPTLTEYTSEEGMFKIEFPGETPTGRPIAVAGVSEPGWQVIGERPSAQEEYKVRCYDLKPEWRKLPPADALEKVAKDELADLGANDPAPQTEQTTHGSFTALDVKATQGSGLNQRDTILRCVHTGKRVYAVSVRGQPEIHQFWWVRQYFLSFEITDPAAKPVGKVED